jgi:hypothetical protein
VLRRSKPRNVKLLRIVGFCLRNAIRHWKVSQGRTAKIDLGRQEDCVFQQGWIKFHGSLLTKLQDDKKKSLYLIIRTHVSLASLLGSI